ncbi:MAG TPA: HD domain-containing phosphohydrolase, partial [Thermoanaerobaculia bacterium]|nr:HD domain-containing phosphohydrolase [Thermoanaerobaculia bacterium]
TPEEMGFLREHPSVGAAIVEPLLGSEVARAVLCHHERADGRGYPNELHGDEIPLLSRVVQLCDAWVAMTDPESYQTPQSPELAQATITRAAGGQFDPELARRFVEMMRR